MADMLNVAVSGLKAFQRALDTTSHNIANATTPGYSRQRVGIVTQEPQSLGSMNLGRGVKVSSVDRYFDSLLTAQMRLASSSYSRLETYADKAGSLNNLFSDNATGLSASLQTFSNALQGVANTPNSTSARQVLLSEAQGLVQRMQTYDQRLDQIDDEINVRLSGEANAISIAAANIAKLNEQIVRQQATTGQPPNDLMDQRDLQISELAKHVSVNVVAQGDGALNVFIGNGQTLVVGSEAGRITTVADQYLPARLSLAYESPGGAKTDLTGVLSGGSVGGLLDFRREMLDPARNELGQIAVGITAAVNQQHRAGMDLSGVMGGDLFRVGGVGVQASTNNDASSTATVGVTRTGAGALTSSDYILSYANNAWSLRRADTGAVVPMTGDGSASTPFSAEGLSIVVGGTPAEGDSFLVQPTSGAIDGLGVTISDPAKIAAAAPIRTRVATTNLGSGAISAGQVTNAADGALTDPVQIAFIDATHYSLNGSGSYTYTPGEPIEQNGWSVTITGAPQAGDTFTVEANAGGVGDNRNALELAAVLGKGVLSGGTESLNAASSRFVGRIGVAANQANVSRDSQQIIYEDTVAANDEVSGVNLDEEAANMVRYQQAYQAAAQVIRITQEIFDSLIRATGR